MAEIKKTKRALSLLDRALKCCKDYRHEFIMPEHLLIALIGDDIFYTALNNFYNPHDFKGNIEKFMIQQDSIALDMQYEPEMSVQMSEVIEIALEDVSLSSAKLLDVPHIVSGIFKLKNSWAAYWLNVCINGNEADFMSHLIGYNESSDKFQDENKDDGAVSGWKKLVTCMNDIYHKHNPLIGREQELKRTIQVLCRRDKNNPLYVGEPGVGKTAIVWGLVCLIEKNMVPQRLIGSRIYQIEMGSLLAGTQYRGDFENRIKLIMDGIISESTNNIIYIDEIHTLVGSGSTERSAMDASNMLKPYIEGGAIRFIGSTTYDEYNRYFSRSKSLIRRFQQIDILEPTINETKNILRQLCPYYEEFHGVSYDDAISFAVESSAKYINERFLPDKAIDIIDEAGAAMEIERRSNVITKNDIANVLAKTCKVSSLSETETDDSLRLKDLSERMFSQIYGQDEAIQQVVEAVQMSKAGLLDENKPLASLLFVGPTGVGKTEIARVLSKELGIELIRFDMSEYAEKHAVAKLIGSPAGYVGYEGGGLLTDAIRKTPNCILLLDELEKAHQDIYNILLQVMDYAKLTDNKGKCADFRNVILIMTSNAGAQFASQASIGFISNVSRGESMMKQVKKTFKPEFLNRLSSAVIFHDMDKQMATLILKKKLGELDSKLRVKNVNMYLSSEAFEYLLSEGYTKEYGAREMDRVITQRLKPLLMREILFGCLKNGGNIKVYVKNGNLSIE